MRCTQFMGLNSWSLELLEKNNGLLYTKKMVNVFLDGTETLPSEEETYHIPKIATPDM